MHPREILRRFKDQRHIPPQTDSEEIKYGTYQPGFGFNLRLIRLLDRTVRQVFDQAVAPVDSRIKLGKQVGIAFVRRRVFAELQLIQPIIRHPLTFPNDQTGTSLEKFILRSQPKTTLIHALIYPE